LFFQRAAFLENDREMERAHSLAATTGDTQVLFSELIANMCYTLLMQCCYIF